MSLGPSLSSATVAASSLIQQSFYSNNNNKVKQDNMIKHHSYNNNTNNTNTNNSNKFSYRTCPICSQKLLVRINGSFVYKWISTHFSTHHHEWMHVVVNLHES